MALPYKLIKSLAIDGTTMGLDGDWGTVQSASKNITLSANTEKEGASLTITEPGTYLFNGNETFPNPGTTGTRSYALLIKMKRNGDASFGALNSMRVAGVSSAEQRATMVATASFSESQVPATVSVFGLSSVALPSGYTGITSCKLVNMTVGV